ncbi:protein PSK SIMULATOR 1-like [Phragmites australis]|uniref:protein PSK SIMULATOR 1-like n=1 Tax=Phragmites australis TaxID=29695 RepID=UPI002D79999F|nr:protein PSK SIMULATOR 1-like [Phragmites australis]XP_062219285.1 protein PSK SIMULATOR 1-like [Phragmites australis]
MGGVCSAGITGDKSPTELSFRAMGFVVEQEFKAFSTAGKNKTAPVEEAVEPDQVSDQSARLSEKGSPPSSTGGKARHSVSKEPHLTRAPSRKVIAGKPRRSTSGKAGPSKVSDIGLVFGRKSTSGLGKAVEVLDNLSSSMSNLSPGGGFVSGATTKGNKISILAFEVANTIVKGMSLMQSLSKESLKYWKDTVLRSEGVERLVSSDTEYLMRIAAADKRQELRVFSREVIRFGNRCKDSQWHNLDRYFSKLESEITPQPELKEIAKAEMQQLMTLVRYTGDLYHELHALDRFQQDYRRKLEEEKSSVTFQRGDTVQIIKQELKSQRKHVHNLKKKSLWSKILDDVMDKLVDIVHFLHVEIQDAFGPCDGVLKTNESSESHQTLGSAGLSLHYANIISQIDNIVSRSSVPPQSTRDALYHGLPPNVKTALRTRLLTCAESQELPITHIRSSMEKTLQWIVPVANNTARAHHGFGWVGEWANTGTDLSRKQPGQPDVLKIETLYHADKEKTDACILDLVVWLHCLISYSRPNKGGRSPSRSAVCSPVQPRHAASRSPVSAASSSSIVLTREDREMLQDVYMRRRSPGRSKSQELSTCKSALNKNDRLSKSSNHSPSRENGGVFPLTTSRSPAVSPVFGFDIDRIRALDLIDRVGSQKQL